MEIKLNNQIKNVSEHCSVQQLINETSNGSQKGIAIAVNNAVVSKLNWQHHLLKQNDDVLIIKATQGG